MSPDTNNVDVSDGSVLTGLAKYRAEEIQKLAAMTPEARDAYRQEKIQRNRERKAERINKLIDEEVTKRTTALIQSIRNSDTTSSPPQPPVERPMYFTIHIPETAVNRQVKVKPTTKTIVSTEQYPANQLDYIDPLGIPDYENTDDDEYVNYKVKKSTSHHRRDKESTTRGAHKQHRKYHATTGTKRCRNEY